MRVPSFIVPDSIVLKNFQRCVDSELNMPFCTLKVTDTLHLQTFGTFFINNSWSWRIPSALQALPSVLQVFLIWFVPESPRWLLSKGRDDEARKVLGYYHANGNEFVMLTSYHFYPTEI